MNEKENLVIKQDLKIIQKNKLVYSKKTLSILLAVVMIITTCSVAFGLSASAYTTPSSTDSVLDELVAALKTDGAMALVNTNDTSVKYTTGTNGSSVSSITNTITTDSYEYYVDIKNLADLIFTEADYAMWYNSSGTYASRGYNAEASVSYNVDTTYDRYSYGENMYSINNELKSRLLSDMGSNDYIAYGVETIIDIIFEEWENSSCLSGKVYSSSLSCENSTAPSTGSTLTYNLSVTTSDYVGWLEDSNNTASDYANMELQATYTLTMSLMSDTYDAGCSNYYYQYVYLFNDDNNDYITTNASTKNTSTVTSFISSAQAYETYMDSFLAYTDFGTAYEHYLDDVVAFENEYNAMLSEQSSMKALLGSSSLLVDTFPNGSDYETILSNYKIAMDAGLYQDAAEGWAAYEADYEAYGTYNYDGGETFGDGVQLAADYVDYTTSYYDILMSATDSAKTYFISEYDLDVNYYTEFTNNVNAYKAAAIKEELDILLEEYADVDPETLESSEQEIIYTTVDSYLTTLSKYDSKITSDITLFGEEDFDEYYDLEATYNTATNSIVAWFLTWGTATYNEYTTTELIAVLDDYDSYVTSLDSFKATLAETVGEERATELLASTYAYTDEVNGVENSIIVYLASRLTGQVSTAVTMFESINVTTYADIDVLTFAALKSSVGAVDTEIYDVLVAEGYWNSSDNYVSSQTILNYDSLEDIIDLYTTFAETLGFDVYEDSSEDYTYSDRDAYTTTDVVKIEEDTSYSVTEETLTEMITTIDSLLQEEEILEVVGELLGVDMSNGISDVVKDLIEDMLFSDDIVTTVVTLIYPLVVDYLAGFEEDYLPNSYYIYVDTIDIEYADTIAGLAGDVGLGFYPEDVAACFTDKTTYADAYAALTSAGRSWYSSSVYTTATQAWSINWGIDDAKASNEAGETQIDIYELFVGALGNGLQGLFPALDALLCGNAFAVTITEAATATFWGVDHEANLYLTLSACDAYVNVLGAIYEIFGYYSYSSTTWMDNNIDNATDVVDMMFSDIYGLIDYICEAPLERILDAIPNLVYSLMFDMLPEMLDLIYTDIYYSVSCEAFGVGAFTIDDIYDGTETLIIGEQLNLADMGLDTSDGIYFIFDLIGIDISGLDEGLLATLGSLEKVTDTNRTQFIYSNSHNGAWYIEADTEDVFYYIVTFLIDYIKTGELYTALSGLMDEEAIAEIKAIIDMTGIGDVTVSSGDIVASIAELFAPINYGDDEYFSLDTIYATLNTYSDENGIEYEAPYGYYYDYDLGLLVKEEYDEFYFVGVDEDGNEIYESLYSEYWTQEQAEFIADDLPNYMSEISALFGLDTQVTEMLTSTVSDLLDSLYTMDTINSILDLVQPLVTELLEDDETIAMIVDLVIALDLVDDIDLEVILEHITTYTCPEFEDGDRTSFIAAIVDLLVPLVPVLDFFLLSSEDKDAVDGTISVYDDAIAVNSYDGYTSALVPLLEALGCDSDIMLTYAEFAASTDEGKIYAIIDPIFDLIDTYLGDTENEFAIYSILEILPNILYFIEYGGLKEVVENILRPVYVVLDTIRPIYNLEFQIKIDVYSLVDELINGLIESAAIEDYVLLTIDFNSLMTTLLTFGYTEERTSVTGDTYNYFVFYEESYSEMVTVVLMELVDELVFGEDIQQYIDLLGSFGSILGEESEVGTLLVGLSEMESSEQVLFALYYIVYGVEAGSEYYDLITDSMLNFFTDVIGLESSAYGEIITRTSDLLTTFKELFNSWEDVDTDNGETSSAESTLNWFQQILADIQSFFEKIFAWLSF